jgi:hypothetical protein
VIDNYVLNGIVDEGENDAHLCAALSTKQRVYFIKLADHLGLAPAGNLGTLLLDDDPVRDGRRGQRWSLGRRNR